MTEYKYFTTTTKLKEKMGNKHRFTSREPVRNDRRDKLPLEDKDAIELINWLRDGKYRIKILRMLSIRPMLPSEIAEELEVTRSSISRILGDLEEKGLISQANTNSRTRTRYLLELGRVILEKMASYIDDA